MLLLDIKTLLQQRGRMNLRDLAIHFHTEPRALEPMLEELHRAGSVRRVSSEAPCSCANCPGCSGTTVGMLCIFEFVGL